jgi:hypothetical protein
LISGAAVSISFADPAVRSRAPSPDTFAGIRPIDLPGFTAAELADALAAMVLMGWPLRFEETRAAPIDPEAQL